MEFSPDAPIELPRQDRLGRSRFAEALAVALRKWRKNESLIVGLFGSWGSGKSSLKNLALHYLSKRAAQSSPQILNFNPWLVSGDEQLAQSFFREIAICLGRPLPGEKQEESASRLAKLSAYFEAFGIVAEHTLDVLSLLGIPGAAFGATVTKGVKRASKAAKKGADIQSELAKGAIKGLSELKDELRICLRDRTNPILVVIDDIDRLTQEEIRLLFRLIKANADFPKFIYLVLCDRSMVTSALDGLAQGKGAAFLEKIVQVAFDVPDPTWDDLCKLARLEWEMIVKGSRDASARSDDKRWNELMILARPYLRHARAVSRWMNAVRFSFEFFKGRRGFDANPEDILALELLRAHEPDLYARISKSKDKLTYMPWDQRPESLWNDSLERQNQFREKIFSSVEQDLKQAAENLVTWLFPNASWVETKIDDSVLLRDLRVGDRRCFERYFRFTFDKGSLSRQEISAAIAATNDSAKFAVFLRKEIARNRLSTLFKNLLAHRDKLRGNERAILIGIFEVGDEMPDETLEDHGEGLRSLATQFAESLLDGASRIERSSILQDGVAEAKGIMLAIALVCRAVSEQQRQEGNEEYFLSTKENLPQLKAVMLSKFREFQNSGVLRFAWDVGKELKTWQLCGGNAEASAWLRQQVKSQRGIIQALRSASNLQRVGDRPWTYTKINVGWLIESIGLDQLESAIANVAWESIDAGDQPLRQLYEVGKKQWDGEKRRETSAEA